MHCDTLFFDFFGTLVDYEEARAGEAYPRTLAFLASTGISMTPSEFEISWQASCAPFEAEARQTHREYPWESLSRAFYERHGEASDEELLGDFRDSFLDEWSEGIVYIDGAREMLDRLARTFQIGLITNTHHTPMVMEHVNAMEIAPYFDKVISSVDFGFRKPSPRIFEHALDSLGAQPQGSLHIGDNPVADFEGAKRADLHALLIDPDDVHAVHADLKIKSVLEVEKWLSGKGLL